MARGKPLTPQEKCRIVKAHAYFTKEEKAGRSGGVETRNRVAECLEIGLATVARVMAYWNKNHGTKFDEPSETKRGVQSKYTSPELRGVIREFVIAENEATRPITAALIATHVAKVMKKKKKIPVRSMRRLLKRLGFFHIRGKHRNFLAERENNVAFRATYLQKKLANRDGNKNPVRHEVFLDESYVNVNHVSNKTWLTENKVRKTKSGKGPRIVMVAAGIISCAANTQIGTTTRSQDEIHGAFVKGSIEHWNSATKKRKNAESDDYHGNFDSEMFETWFTNLCITLEKDYGPCNIHMDGASYHKRLTNPTPSKSWLEYDRYAFAHSLLEPF